MTGLIYDPRFLNHDTGPGHAERAERLRAIVARLKERDVWDSFIHLPFDAASEESVLICHTRRHMELVQNAYAKGLMLLDEGDTFISEESASIALLAVGGAMAAVDAVATSEVDNAFCIMRPPGHHAESDRPMGFCLYNNAAIAARYAQQHYSMERVAIMDWDVHHGNGTQEIFYNDPSVLYISTHQSPLYPGTGAHNERGAGAGEGFTLNIPLPAGAGEPEFVSAFQKDVLPAIDSFKPDLLIISAGFDAHRDDPLANLELTEHSFGLLSTMLIESAAKHCNGRVVSLLEGGYNLEALAGSVEEHVSVLLRG